MKGNFLILILLFCIQVCEAQDPRFSQFYIAPDQLNPALGVVYDGKARFIANYRNQWSSILQDVPFRTMAAHFDIRQAIGKDYMSLGFNVLKDEAGSSKLNRTKGSINLAYMKYLGGTKDKDFYLVAGAQAGVGQHHIAWDNLWFSEQYNSSKDIIDYKVSTGEVENRKSNIYPDFNAGLLWYLLAEEYSFYFGAAMYHINQPNISLFEGNSEPLSRRYVGHLGGEIKMNKQLSLLPAAAVSIQGPSTEGNIGANFRYSTNERNELAMRLGAWAHLAEKEENGMGLEAVTLSTMLEMNTWTLGLSYDINTSGLNPATNYRGAFEASFIYIIPEGKRRFKISCPKF
jgi:type IX secretion system PorP/SprF family membrane protein